MKIENKDSGKEKKASILGAVSVSLLFLLILLSPLGTAGAARRGHEEAGRYAITLISAKAPINIRKQSALPAFSRHTLYTSEFRSKQGTHWYRLRLGFFPTKKAAEEELRYIKGNYKTAWISKVSVRERESVPSRAVKSVSRRASRRAPVRKGGAGDAPYKAAFDKIGKTLTSKGVEYKAAMANTGKKIALWSKKTYSGMDEHLKKGFESIGNKKKDGRKEVHTSSRSSRTVKSQSVKRSTVQSKSAKSRTVKLNLGRGDAFRFDHFKTGFPLDGFHVNVKCESCHTRGIFKNTPSRCSECHSKGAMVKATTKSINHTRTNAPCESCHVTNSWVLSRFTHTADTFGRCYSCHNGTTNAGKPATHLASSNNCDDCHSSSTWLTARFDHSGVTGACATCHNGATATGKPNGHVVTNSACDDCHSTRAWIPAGFDHSGVTSPCATCHNGATATGKPQGHIQSNDICDDCHTTRAWIPASFDHSGVTGSCSTCHNGTTAPGKPNGHFVTTQECNECHDTRAWTPVTTFHHSTANYPGDHRSSVECLDCHKGNSEIISWQYGAYKPDCAGCHAGRYKEKAHKKTKNPTTIYYPVSELRDCSGACHRYTDNTFTVIEKHHSSHHHASDGGW